MGFSLDPRKALEAVADAATGGSYSAGKNALEGNWGGATASMIPGFALTNDVYSMVGGGKNLLGDLTAPDVSKQWSTSGVNLAPESDFEKRLREDSATDYGNMRDYVNMGPGGSEIAQGQTATKDLASMLESYKNGGFLPGVEDWNTANMFADKAFQPQQVAMQQQFQQQNIRANQLAAQLGRPANDPIIQSKLAQEQMQGAERVGASKSAYASEYAQSLPQQRLVMQGQLTDVRNSLASQAMSNRQALLGLGNQLQSQERNWRLQTGQQYSTGTSESGGGLRAGIGAIAGLIGAGASAFGNIAGGVSKLRGSAKAAATATDEGGDEGGGGAQAPSRSFTSLIAPKLSPPQFSTMPVNPPTSSFAPLQNPISGETWNMFNYDYNNMRPRASVTPGRRQ